MINGRNLCNSIITPPGGIGTRALENAQIDLIECQLHPSNLLAALRHL